MIQMRNNSQIQGKYICLQRIKPINTTNYKESEDMCSIMGGGGGGAGMKTSEQVIGLWQVIFLCSV